MSSKPEFERGQLVCHRASGTYGVVVSPVYECTIHRGPAVTSADHLLGKGCQRAFAGRYTLSVEFEEELDVEEYLLDPVEEASAEE
ncbi:MAG: hypothetical protein ACYTG0_10700 [Planctomycetota bacterium]|jgi:hypothetical protein